MGKKHTGLADAHNQDCPCRVPAVQHGSWTASNALLDITTSNMGSGPQYDTRRQVLVVVKTCHTS